MKVLIVDDDANIRRSIRQTLEFEQIESSVAENGLSAKRLLEQDVFTVVVTDVNMPGLDGLGLLKWIQQEGPAVPVVVMSAYADVKQAVEAMKIGAEDYLVKPFDSQELLIRLSRIEERQQTQTQLQAGLAKADAAQEWIGEDQAIQDIKALIAKIAPTPASVLITGESGTGKEVVANTIHQFSQRRNKAFIAINIGGIPDTLLESELFGYERGAFTGANTRKIGMFELASGGTLFLDEIGDMPLQLQVKLLRVIQERKIQRLGSVQHIPIDVRIVAATNSRLEDRIQNGNFREDLFYRLNVFHLHLPPLRERPDDIPLFTGYFLQKFNRSLGKHVVNLEPDAMQVLQRYPFPGNIRELQNILERAVILASSESIALSDLGLVHGIEHPVVRQGTLADIERGAILNALRRWEGRRAEVAHELGISRKTLFNKIKRYQLDSEL